MPILAKEPDIYPPDLFEYAEKQLTNEGGEFWWALYTISRREKELMRRLSALQIPFYCPIVPQRHRSPNGRLRTSYQPLFSNYVFLFGDSEHRYAALQTNCVARDVQVKDGATLTKDLRQIRALIETGVPVTREEKLQSGDYVRVKSGAFRGYEGVILRREGKRRLLVEVKFLQQGVSVQLDDCEVEPY